MFFSNIESAEIRYFFFVCTPVVLEYSLGCHAYILAYDFAASFFVGKISRDSTRLIIMHKPIIIS
jgi:hypothetical protein